MPRFLHAADIHLDSPLQRLESYEGAPVDEIRGATRRALERLVDTAIERDVDFVVIAGDLYDGDWRDHQTGLFFVNQAARLVAAGIPLLVIRGNHDAASQMTRSLPLPKNPDDSSILIGTEQPESRLMESAGVVVHGQSFGTRAITENLAAQYPPRREGYLNIGLLHTSLTGADGHEPYAPCTPEQLAAMGYHYWALGHVHHRGMHHHAGEAPIVFSGNIQGRHVRETGPKGCYLVEYEGTEILSLDFVPLDVVRWEVLHHAAESATDFDQLVEGITEWMETVVGEVAPRLLVCRIVLEGTTPLHGDLLSRHEHYESNLRAQARAMVGDRVWIEGLRIQTQAPVSRNQQVGSAAIASVLQAFDELGSEPWSQTDLKGVLAKLRRQLGDPDFADSPDQLLDEARASLLSRLRGTEDD